MAGRQSQPNNKNAEKFKTPAERQRVFKRFCKHLSEGYSPKTFHDGCVEQTMLNMFERYPDDFDMEELAIAKAMGNHSWEAMGKLGTGGGIDGFNAASWKFIMGNKLNWKEKVEQSSDPENPPGILSPAERAVLDHYSRKAIFEHEQKKLPPKPKQKD